MFGIFRKKSEIEKLEDKYSKLLEEWHSLSTVNRTASDLKYAEAQDVISKIEKLISTK